VNHSPVAATVAAILAVATQVTARVPAPLVPTALVEDVKSTTADIEFMDYVGNGQVIKLDPRDVLVLSYLNIESGANVCPTAGVVSARAFGRGGKALRGYFAILDVEHCADQHDLAVEMAAEKVLVVFLDASA
jgi:hypothetical protein